jgi:plasmid stabilization system protein ParE
LPTYSLRNPLAAGRVLERIEPTIARLGEFPHFGHATDEPGVRVIAV